METEYTYDDYIRMTRDGELCQLIDGGLVRSPSPSTRHQRISRRIEIELCNFVAAQGLGEVWDAPLDVYLAENQTFQPDIFFISNERSSIIGEKKIEGAPDLVIEILSPSTAYYDIRKKKRVYESTGVREYWIVDPEERSIEVYENRDGCFIMHDQAREDGRVASKLLPGFSIGIVEVFR